MRREESFMHVDMQPDHMANCIRAAAMPCIGRPYINRILPDTRSTALLLVCGGFARYVFRSPILMMLPLGSPSQLSPLLQHAASLPRSDAIPLTLGELSLA